MRTTTVIIGAGHAGLAMSSYLTSRSIDHVIIERGEVANSWKKERWDSLRLLTPNWQSRLPGYAYSGNDPDGFRSMPEVIEFIEDYARAIAAPIHTNTTVLSVRPHDDGYEVITDRGVWRARAVVIASGPFAIPNIPRLAEAVPASVQTITTKEYRNPSQLPEGGVLVVGASASGVQIARELQVSGRPVTLAVGEHVRVPRTYRGRDIKWWMDSVGLMNDLYTEFDDVGRVRGLSSLQLVGSDDRHNVDLNSLTDMGIEIVGRLAGINGDKAQFSGSLANLTRSADLKLNRLLDRFDKWSDEYLGEGAVEPIHRFEPTRIPGSPRLGLSLASGEIKTILWATGYRPDYSWLDVPVLDRKGNVRHEGGVVDSPGMYLMGLPFMRRRKSSLIDGAGDDARDLSEHLSEYLAGRGKTLGQPVSALTGAPQRRLSVA